MMDNVLMQLLLVPLIASIAYCFLGSFPKRLLKGSALVISLLPLALLILHYPFNTPYHISYPWIKSLHVNFSLGIDSLSLIFLFLSSLVIPLSIVASGEKEQKSLHFFYSLVFLLQLLLTLFFTAQDLIVFTISWEAMLLPLYFMITLWGGAKRASAALKFLIYMIAGSSLLIAGVFGLYFSTGISGEASFDMKTLSHMAPHLLYSKWLFAIFLLAFAVKTPLFPFHAWLPDAYCEATPSSTILLSAILSKAGIYGLYRIGYGFFASAMHQYALPLFILALVGVLYGALSAWRQNDIKRVIAYSSFSHVNFILAAVFIGGTIALTGGLMQVINHGITIGALFLVAGFLETIFGRTSLDDLGGLARYLPKLCWLTMFFVLSAVALPGTNNFIGEFIVLYGVFVSTLFNGPLMAAILGTSIILSVVYMLRWMKEIFFGSLQTTKTDWNDINAFNLTLSLPLVALILWIGLYPMPVLNLIEAALKQ